MDVQVVIAVISTIGGIIIAYIVNVVAKRRKAHPRDRMETIFEGYEKLISQQQIEIDRKTKAISSLEKVVNRLEDELQTTRELLGQARQELSISRENNEDLQTQLIEMRKEYKAAH